MKKNDKIVVVAGVAILILASIGIYYWDYEAEVETVGMDQFISLTGVLKDTPAAITVSDSCPFYPLIATPVAINYDADGLQKVIPLYVKDFENPSSAVIKAEVTQIGILADEIVDESESAKDVSLRFAKDYWESSTGALIIEYTQEGYNLGVLATPLASYLSIPVIVTDEIDADVLDVFSELGVERTIVCGDLEGYGEVLKFNNVGDVVNASIEIVTQKFKKVDYITLTNPVDAWPPEVLDSVTKEFDTTTLGSGASSRPFKAGQAGQKILGTFTIPEDYKYALVKFEGINLDHEDVDAFGDYVDFRIGADLEDIPDPLTKVEIYGGSTAAGGIVERDANGKITKDKVYVEAVLYDRGGVKYNIRVKGQWMLKETGKCSGTVTIEKLENPVYPMMKQLSSLAPYITAYHNGIIFGKPEFAFTADDHILTEKGEPSPGFYMPRRNPRINDAACKHIFDNIHGPLNEILAKLADIKIRDDRDLKTLREYYDDDPINIAIVGGATGVPNYIYQNYLEPVDYENGQYSWGVGTPSDVIYGNIDPQKYVWDNIAEDIYTDYPYQENVVGRITGYDAQDASALIARSVFYNEILEGYNDWKDSMAIIVGEGLDFRQPPIRYPIANAMGITHRGEPMKMWTGFGEIAIESFVEEIAKPLGFTTIHALYKEPAAYQGFSDGDIQKIKETSLFNKLLLRTRQVEKLLGDDNIKGGDAVQNSNFVFMNGHGNKNTFVTAGIDTVFVGMGGPIMQFLVKKIMEVLSPYSGNTNSLQTHMAYDTRHVSEMDFGPSFLMLESCICGKIDGMYPENNVGQAFIHAGVTSFIASPTGTNIPGGYLEPKNKLKDTPWTVLKAYRTAKKNAKNGIYPDHHFGALVYKDICFNLKNDGGSIGMAFRDAKNDYLPQDADWELWWSPPLVAAENSEEYAQYQQSYTDNMKSEALADPYMMKNKYTTFQEFMLFGDPALEVYVPPK